MKSLFIFLSVCTMVGCNNGIKNQEVVIKDTTETVVAPPIDLRKKVEQDSVRTEVPQSTKIAETRKKLKAIQMNLEKALVTQQTVTVKGTEAKVNYHWRAGDLLKIELREELKESLTHKEYYLSNKQPLLVFEMQTNRVEMEDDPDYYEPAEDSLFFYENKLIRIICNLDCGGPFATKYLMEEEMRVKAELDVLLSAAE